MIVLPAPGSSARTKRNHGWGKHMPVHGLDLMRQTANARHRHREDRAMRIGMLYPLGLDKIDECVAVNEACRLTQ